MKIETTLRFHIFSSIRMPIIKKWEGDCNTVHKDSILIKNNYQFCEMQ